MAVANIKKAYKGTQLMEMVREARERTFGLVADLTDEQLMGPRLAIVNPLSWEIGHVAWFQERWTLRDRGQLPSMLSNADALYDSAAIPHDVRWDLPLPSREWSRHGAGRGSAPGSRGLRDGAAPGWMNMDRNSHFCFTRRPKRLGSTSCRLGADIPSAHVRAAPRGRGARPDRRGGTRRRRSVA